MNNKTIQQLNKINKEFYQTVGDFFSSSRNYSWPGWETAFLAPTASTEVSSGRRSSFFVLDLGCGNGRFLDFLLQNKIDFKEYIGVDSSEKLLKIALEKYQIPCTELQTNGKSEFDKGKINFIETDITKPDWIDHISATCPVPTASTEVSSGRRSRFFDLIVAFGLLHHIPSTDIREKLFEEIHSVLKKDGFFVFTTWNFLKIPRLAKKVIDLESDFGKLLLKKYDIDQNELDEYDCLLDWDRGLLGIRYCRFLDDKEIIKLLSKTNFKVVDSFLEDGKEHKGNKYWIVKKINSEI